MFFFVTHLRFGHTHTLIAIRNDREPGRMESVKNSRWFNPRQPQTLQGAVVFSYLNAAFALLALLTGSSPVELIVLLGGVGAFGIANDKKWGYVLGLVASIGFLMLQLLLFYFNPFAFSAVINLVFSIFLVALLLHPASRLYQRVYFE